VDDAAERRIKEARFDLAALTPQTRKSVGELLAATLSAPGFDDEDVEAYIGCTRADLDRVAAAWAGQASMSLWDADDAWLTLTSAFHLRPWHSWVPATPPADALKLAYEELYEPIHRRVVRLANQ
jgi:hypothetical protein